MTQKMIDEIAVALNQGLYLVALSAALTLPDVCGKAEYPEERVSTRYKKWYSTFVPDGICRKILCMLCVVAYCMKEIQMRKIKTTLNFN